MSFTQFTIFTPTYNRAHTLSRVYKSLKSQTYHNFEWLIIDDGSTDETRKLIESYQRDSSFPIIYNYQNNEGKYKAYNKALSLARGELMITLDSDDALHPDTLTKFSLSWDTLSSIEKKIVGGVIALCRNSDTGKIIGEELISDAERSLHLSLPSALEYQLKRKLYIDKCVAQRVDMLKDFPFPENKHVQFIPEALIGNRISKEHQFLILNEPLKDVYYQSNGYSKNIIYSYINDADGRYLYHLSTINEIGVIVLRYDPIRFAKDIIQTFRMGFHADIPLLTTFQSLDTFILKGCSPAAAIIGYLLSFLDRITLRNETR